MRKLRFSATKDMFKVIEPVKWLETWDQNA